MVLDMVLMNGVMLQRMDIEPINWFTPASNGERSTRKNTGRLNVRHSPLVGWKLEKTFTL